MENYPIDANNKVKRIPKRGHYDKQTVYEILDEAFVCHAGFVIDGRPFVIPTAYGREGDTIYLHGASKSRMMESMKLGIPVCITVTHLDGIVLARSSFNHSMNYRSAVCFGKGRLVEGKEEKNRALKIISDNILAGRWEEAREPNDTELKATHVIAVEIEQASAKIRTGDIGDDKPDYHLDVWAGVVPMTVQYQKPIPDPLLREETPLAKSVEDLFHKKN